jgi:hypothetical protein
MHCFNKIVCGAALMILPGLAIAKYSDLNSPTYVNSNNREWHDVPTKQHADSWITAEGKAGQKPHEGKGSKGKKAWKELTPRQRKRIEQRHKQYEALPASEKEKVKKARQQYRDLPPERRQELREKWEKMSPEERRKKS